MTTPEKCKCPKCGSEKIVILNTISPGLRHCQDCRCQWDERLEPVIAKLKIEIEGLKKQVGDEDVLRSRLMATADRLETYKEYVNVGEYRTLDSTIAALQKEVEKLKGVLMEIEELKTLPDEDALYRIGYAGGLRTAAAIARKGRT